MKLAKLAFFGIFLAALFALGSRFTTVNNPVSEGKPQIENKTIIASSARRIILDKELLKNKLSLKAKAFVVRDLDTGEDVLQQNGEVKLPIASVTKLITAMVVLDNFKPDEIIKISKFASNTLGHQCSLFVGEKFKTIDLLNCLLLESSNDAAEAFAEHFGRDNFLLLMNRQTAALGMNNTHFKDPSGLSSSNVSTSEDLTRLMAYIESKRTDILAITKKKNYQVDGGILSRKHVWYNINRLIRDNNSYYSGGKDGFTSDALMTFTGAFSIPITELENKKFAIAILKSSDRNGDVKKIIDRVVRSLKYEDGLAAVPTFNKKGTLKIAHDQTLSMAFVGDILINDANSVQFGAMPYVGDSDIVYGNLEGPISDLGYDIGNKDSRRMNPAVIQTLKDAGFVALSVANDHIGDWGITALEDTLKRLNIAGIQAVGGGLNGEDASRIKIVEKNGVKMGFIGFSDAGPAWLIKNKDLPTIVSAEDPNFEKIISDSARQVDHLVVGIRFSNDAEKGSVEHRRKLAQQAIDAGAKIVVGSYPKIAEDIEKYKDGLIIYSLGDITSGAVLNVVLDKKMILEANEDGI